MTVPLMNMTPEEKERNSHGPMSSFTYTSKDLGVYQAPAYFPEISINHAHLEKVRLVTLSADQSQLPSTPM